MLFRKHSLLNQGVWFHSGNAKTVSGWISDNYLYLNLLFRINGLSDTSLVFLLC